MTNKTKGWLMLVPVIVSYLAVMIFMVGWEFIPLMLGGLAFAWWTYKAISYVNAKD